MAAEHQKKRRNKIWIVLIFIAVNAAVIGYTAVKEFGGKPAEKLGFHFGFSNWMFILGGLFCMVLTLAIETAKYLIMMKTLEVRVSVRAAFETAALGKYYDNITPSGVGGQPFQIYNMHKEGYSGGVSAAMPLTSFVTMQSGFVILAICVFIFMGNAVDILAIRIPAYIGVVCYMAMPTVILIFTISEKAGIKLISGLIKLGGKLRIVKHPKERCEALVGTMREYRQSILMIGRKKGVLFLLFGLSVIYQISMCSIPFFVLRAYNGTASFLQILAMTVFIYCAITIIPTPGNAGAAEGSFYLLFSELDPTGLFWSMLIWRAICYYAYIVIGLLIYLFQAIIKKDRRRKT